MEKLNTGLPTCPKCGKRYDPDSATCPAHQATGESELLARIRSTGPPYKFESWKVPAEPAEAAPPASD